VPDFSPGFGVVFSAGLAGSFALGSVVGAVLSAAAGQAAVGCGENSKCILGTGGEAVFFAPAADLVLLPAPLLESAAEVLFTTKYTLVPGAMHFVSFIVKFSLLSVEPSAIGVMVIPSIALPLSPTTDGTPPGR